jgi:hypothetical protein
LIRKRKNAGRILIRKPLGRLLGGKRKTERSYIDLNG